MNFLVLAKSVYLYEESRMKIIEPKKTLSYDNDIFITLKS